jgi:hypothetical protein
MFIFFLLLILNLNNLIETSKSIEDDFDVSLYDLIGLPTTDGSRAKTYKGSYIKNRRDIRLLTDYPGAWYGRPSLPKNNTKFISILTDMDERWTSYFLRNFVNRRFQWYDLVADFYEYPPEFTLPWFIIPGLVHVNLEKIRAPNWMLNEDALTILYRYGRCSQNKNSYYNCPNPCNRIPCSKIKNAKDHSCIAFYDRDKTSFLSPKLEENKKFSNIFKYRFKCSCEKGYKWDNEDIGCTIDQRVCNEENPCFNGAHCIVLNDRSAEFPYKCNFLFILPND